MLDHCVKVAITLGFLGTRYYGSLYNPALPTIEGDLRCVVEKLHANPWGRKVKSKYEWSAISRTDAGVHACRLSISVLLLPQALDMNAHCGDHLPHFVCALNEELLKIKSDIIVYDAVIAPRSFDARSSCGFREYRYFIPTRFLCREESSTSSSTIQSMPAYSRLQSACAAFIGVFSYHNFVKVSKVNNLKGFASSHWNQLPFTKNAVRREPFSWETRTEGWVSKSTRNDDESPLNNGNVFIRYYDPLGPAEDWEERYTIFEEWPLRVLRETQTEIYSCDVTVLQIEDDDFIEIRLVGDSFCYNQIRYMVGAALCVANGKLPLAILQASLMLPLAVRWPLAPANGLVLVSGGFPHADISNGIIAMDAEQDAMCNGAPDGSYSSLYLMLDSKPAEQFLSRILRDISHSWKVPEDKGIEEWIYNTNCISLDECARFDIEEALRAYERGDDLYGKKKVQRELSRTAERVDFVSSFIQGETSDGDTLNILRNSRIWPSQFAVSLCTRFHMLPGRRLKNIQLALASRIVANDISSSMDTDQLLDIVASGGLATFEKEGKESVFNFLRTKSSIAATSS